MASVPCGLLRDLLSLDWSGVTDFTLYGVDLDPDSLQRASALSRNYGLEGTSRVQAPQLLPGVLESRIWRCLAFFKNKIPFFFDL